MNLIRRLFCGSGGKRLDKKSASTQPLAKKPVEKPRQSGCSVVSHKELSGVWI